MRNNLNDASVQLNRFLRTNKSFLFPVFSLAHIIDLKNDSTDNKFKDTLFIEEIAGQHMLCYDAVYKQQKFLRVSPSESLKDHLNDPSFNPANFFDCLDDLKTGEFSEQFNQLLDLPLFDFDTGPINSETYQETLMDFLPYKAGKVSIRDIMNHIEILIPQLFDKDNQLYKNTRKVNIDQFKLNQIDYTLSTLNGVLKKSPFGKDLFELITATAGAKKVLSTSEYFTQGFVVLNMLGLDKEKNKKTNFISLSIDSKHAHYGSLCDILITEDKGLRIKAELLYNLKNISTQIMSTSEFLEFYNGYQPEKIQSEADFILKIFELVNKGTPYSTNKSSQFNRLNFYYSINESFFDFFNALEVIKDDTLGNCMVLTAKRANYDLGLFYSEVEMITNKIVFGFGPDMKGLTNYTKDDEVCIAESKWQGRFWDNYQIPIALEINRGTNKLSICIGPI